MSVEELEQLRQKALKMFFLGFGITMGVSLILVFMIGFSVPIYIHFIILSVALVLAMVIGMFSSSNATEKYRRAYKDKYVLSSLKKVFTDLEYKPDYGLNSSVVSSAGMTTGDRYSSNDLIYGKYKDISVIQADVCIEEERESRDKDGNVEKYYVTVFEGRWMVFDFNKEFKQNMQIREKWFYGARASRWGKNKYYKQKMEDVQFNKEFNVFTQNEHEAFYILTPRMMERIRSLNANLSGRLLLSFTNNKLHIGLHNGKDSFECSIFKKINEEEILDEVTREIKIITDCIDELNLDNDLFRKDA